MKTRLITLLVLALVFTPPVSIHAKALTAYDVYREYSVPYAPTLSADVVHTVQQAHYELPQLASYQWLEASSVSVDAQPMKEKVDYYAARLDDGYDLTLSEIEDLEQRYLDAKQEYERLEAISNMTSTVSAPSVDAAKYEKAKELYNAHKAQTVLTPNFLDPVSAEPKALDDVHSVFSGRVESIDKHGTLTISSNDNVRMVYKNTFHIFPSVGDEVSANAVVAAATKDTQVYIVLNGHTLKWRHKA